MCRRYPRSGEGKAGKSAEDCACGEWNDPAGELRFSCGGLRRIIQAGAWSRLYFLRTDQLNEMSAFELRKVLPALMMVAMLAPAACDRSTSRLSAEQERRFQSEGVRRRADDIMFRFTRDPGGRSERWEDRRASIIVTDSSVLIHKNEKVGLEITPRTRREVSVQRSGGRIRLRSGRGRSEEMWSFQPESDAEGWATDIRATIKGVDSGKR